MSEYFYFALNQEEFPLVVSYLAFLSEFQTYANSYGSEKLKEAEKLLSHVCDAFSGMASGDTETVDFGCHAVLSR